MELAAAESSINARFANRKMSESINGTIISRL